VSAAAAAIRARLGAVSPGSALPAPRPLVADPLPPLTGPPDGSATEGTAGGSGRVDPSVAAVVCRGSVFHACAAVDGGYTDASELRRDGGAAAVTMAALARVAAGEGAASPGDASPDDASLDDAVSAFAGLMGAGASLSAVTFVTPELGRWSTVGGLGVMVDELTIGVARLGVPVTVVSPFYDRDKKGRPDYLRADRILFTGRVVTVTTGPRTVRLGLHAGLVRGVRLLFLHNADVFPAPYPALGPEAQTAQLAVFGKACLQALCDVAGAEARGEGLFVPGHGPEAGPTTAGVSGPLSDAEWLAGLAAFSGHTRPSVVVTNDWFTGLVPAYARAGHFGRWFDGSDFLHICHNLDPSYEGRIYPGDKVSRNRRRHRRRHRHRPRPPTNLTPLP